MAKHVFVLRGGRWQPLPRPAHAVSISSSLAAITIWQNVFAQIANVFVQITKSIWSDSKMYLSKWPNVFVQISKWHSLYWGKSPGLRLKERSLRKILEVPAVPYGGTKRGKRWGSWVGRGAQRWNGGAETIGCRVYKRAARPPRPQLRSHPASMTVTQVARKYLGKKFNFLKFCDKLLSFDWREVFPNQQPGKLWFDWNFETLKLWSLENRSQKGAKSDKNVHTGSESLLW